MTDLQSTPTLTPTPEQQAIVEAGRSTQTNLLISALAGAAKTSTLVMLAQAIRGIPILCLAFNKRIAEEMRTRMPPTVDCFTMNALGHRVWSRALGTTRLRLDSNKTTALFRAFKDRLGKADQEALGELYSEVSRLVRTAKFMGFVPIGQGVEGLSTWGEVVDSLDDDIPDLASEAAQWILTESIRLSYAGEIDFDDQIYMSTLFGGTFPRYPLVMIDEAQDLSPLNHAMLAKLATGRLIAVGDPHQSIYGFRGAMSDGMDELRQTFRMQSLPLSVSFRCPKAIIRNVHDICPQMRWPEWAAEGSIIRHTSWSHQTIPDGAAVICRNNAPIYWLAFELIRQGRGIEIVGSDISAQLVKTLTKLGPKSMLRDEVKAAVQVWKLEQLRKGRSEQSVGDRAACLNIFADQGDNLGQAIAYAEILFAQKGPVQLLSGHKSKGLEWPIVFHLDSWRIGRKFKDTELSQEELQQERNVRYVIETRAKSELHYIDANLYEELTR